MITIVKDKIPKRLKEHAPAGCIFFRDLERRRKEIQI